MTCPACNDLGALPVRYHGETEPSFALCLCAAGELLRRVESGYPTWHLWAHQRSIQLDRIVMLEDYATPQELSALGFRELTADGAMDAIVAAARSRKAR